jgi:hypothetical protein
MLVDAPTVPDGARIERDICIRTPTIISLALRVANHLKDQKT